MAISAAAAARLSPLVSANAKPNNDDNKASGKARGNDANAKTTLLQGGRRRLVLVPTVTAALVADSRTDLLDKYLKKSQENKAKNDKERLDSYYKRNYKDYFELLEGGLRKREDLSEAEKGILEWLDSNKK